ncbi:E3 ubiquitin-protein ligase SH3RF3 isoform X2 [Aphidius gifuensis]|uniref:E3 ubiquitin-protein ligase SH3RF3 isoform X2 n=1 Tax=Aphidius gifuensis TaxID=684658 RepID=UPI001CDB576F|nr:E3 ubiquitin-protein ligase SH3RF3 isoform X2 [Aphidius gifuensis]
MDECMLNDLLECSVCLERLDTSSKVLPCQHTFCKKCLEEIMNRHRELRCPECRVLVDIKIDNLPPNVLLMRILEGMRNATPKSTKSHVRNTPGQQQQQQRHFRNHQNVNVPNSVSTNVSPIMVTVDPTRHPDTSAKQVHLHNQPYGRAIYDYISKVPGDLSFKKGEIVVLRKKIDNNWYFGESGGNYGVFPLSYIQVMTPLPPHVPQCKAMYDFRMTNDEEDGCLTFNKGEVISVIRRVDENWAEGKLLDKVGIFPLAFVELNSVARALMKLSSNVQPGPSRVAPPTPTNDDTTPLIPTDHTRNIQTSNQPRPQQVIASTLLVSDSSSSTVSSSGSSTTTTSPNTPNSSTTSSSSSTAPSSPCSPISSPSTVGGGSGGINRVKRHSFTAINNAHPPLLQNHPHHRHSAEILSQPDTNFNDTTTTVTAAATATITTTTIATTTTTTTPINNSNNIVTSGEHNIRHRRSGSSDLVLTQLSSNHTIFNTTNLPTAYIALYPYKPQKADELELRKGGIYMVTERCQDGWFKGTSNRTQKCGVFPGNYVTPAKCQRGICRVIPPSNHPNSLISIHPSNDPRTTVTYTKNKNTLSTQCNSRSLPPPELPPRAISPSPAVSASWHGQAQGQSSTITNEQASSNPLGRSHSAVMTSNIASPGKTTLTPASPSTISCPVDSNRSPNNTLRLTGGVTPSPPSPNTSNSSTNTASSSAKNSDKIKSKEKKEKGVSIMRRLTNMKKSKSPPPAPYSMDNPVFDDGNFTSSSNAVHVRSGDTAGGVVPTTARGNHHQKSNSLDAGMGKQSKQQLVPRERERLNRFRCIVPYPPNSEFELELRVGDIIYVQKKRDDGWYKGTLQRTGRSGLFPASFVESF